MPIEDLRLSYSDFFMVIYAFFIILLVAHDLFSFELNNPNQLGLRTFSLISTQRITTKQMPMTIEFKGLIGVSLSYLKRRYRETTAYIQMKISDANGFRRNFI